MKSISPKEPAISSVTTGVRQSNIELLRILAMFLVLVIHAIMNCGGITADNFGSNPANAITRTVIHALSAVCVNVFILISGWFGIKSSLKGFLKFAFQCLYFSFGIYLFMIATGNAHLSVDGIRTCLFLKPPHYWFIPAYVALYILSPILNSFIDKASKTTLRNTLVAFFVFQTIWGWTGAAKFIEFGYSSFSFIGLYLLARYLRLYPCKRLASWGGTIYIASVLINSVCFYIIKRLGSNLDVFCYINPLVIIGAAALLVYFDKLPIGHNKTINWISRSAFSAYLYHGHPMINDLVFFNIISYIYNGYSGISCIALTFAVLTGVFMSAVIIDQPRIWLWNKISPLLMGGWVNTSYQASYRSFKYQFN